MCGEFFILHPKQGTGGASEGGRGCGGPRRRLSFEAERL